MNHRNAGNKYGSSSKCNKTETQRCVHIADFCLFVYTVSNSVNFVSVNQW